MENGCHWLGRGLEERLRKCSLSFSRRGHRPREEQWLVLHVKSIKLLYT